MQLTSATNGMRTKLLTIAALSTTGLLISGYLTSHFYSIRSGMAGTRSICNISQTMNCDAIAASSFAEVFSGLPLSSFAAGFYLGLLLLVAIASISSAKKEATQALTGMTFLGLLGSCFYFMIMAFHLKTYCLFCLGLDGINLLLFLFALSLKPEKLNLTQPAFSKWRNLLLGFAGCIAFAVVCLSSLDQMSLKASDINDLAQSILDAPVHVVPSEPNDPALGPESAPIRIVEFSDYECPHCKMAAQIVGVIKDRYGDKVRVELRNFPLDQSCNPEMKGPGHTAACEAAKVVVCANKQGRLEEMYHTLFEKQETLRPGRPRQIASDLGLDMPKLESCMSDPETTNAILRDIQLGMKLNISSTPTLFVNGHKMEGPYPVQAWIKIIDQLLKI